MRYRTFKMLRALTVIIAATLVVWSAIHGNAWIPVPIVIAEIIILLLFRRVVKEVVTDERIFSVADKAARLAFRSFAIIAVTVGATLLAVSHDTYPEMQPTAFTLIYSACALALLYLISYSYYNRKFGGKE